MITEHGSRNKYDNEQLWDTAKMTEMWHRDAEWANAVGKIALTDLSDTRLPQTFGLLKMRYLPGAMKWGLPTTSVRSSKPTTFSASNSQLPASPDMLAVLPDEDTVKSSLFLFKGVFGLRRASLPFWLNILYVYSSKISCTSWVWFWLKNNEESTAHHLRLMANNSFNRYWALVVFGPPS